MRYKEKYYVTKASGESSVFLPEKLFRSLEKAGASRETTEEILKELENELYNGIPTRVIYEKAFKLLKKQRKKPFAARYKLKNAIMELGPSGFPFEIYISEIFRHQGYKVETGRILNGKCVKHEIDIIAEKGNDVFLMECKFHNKTGSACDVKVPLYIHSRFNDVKNKLLEKPENKHKNYYGWVVTNTKFTGDATQYGICSGLKLLGWDFPQKESLREIIDKYRLYPVTTLTKLTRTEKEQLLNMKVILCKDLIENKNILKNIGLKDKHISDILYECENLCNGKNSI